MSLKKKMNELFLSIVGKNGSGAEEISTVSQVIFNFQVFQNKNDLFFLSNNFVFAIVHSKLLVSNDFNFGDFC